MKESVVKETHTVDLSIMAVPPTKQEVVYRDFHPLQDCAIGRYWSRGQEWRFVATTRPTSYQCAFRGFPISPATRPGRNPTRIMEIVLHEARGAANATAGLLAASVSCHLASLPLWTSLGALDNSDVRGTVTVRITSRNRRLPLEAQPGPQIESECQCQAPR